MKATMDESTRATDTIVKAKQDRVDTLDPTKFKFKAPGKASNRCKRKFSSPDYPDCLPIQSVTHRGKFRLQLFPIDSETKNILEQNNHNPYLELTLATNKKISSVVKHLREKWGDSFGSSTEEIMLFPYSAKSGKLIGIHKWTSSDTHITAADVHSMIGAPSIFRLKYGCLLNTESATNERLPPQLQGNFHFKESLLNTESATCRPPFSNLNGEKGPTSLKEPFNSTIGAQQQSNVQGKFAPLTSWLDSVSNMSFGALLSEASPYLEGANPLSQNKNLLVNQASFTCDSFDAAIGALIARQQPTNCQPAPPKTTNDPSIWDAEETCHAFSAQKPAPLVEMGHVPCKDAPGSKVGADSHNETHVETDDAGNAERKNEIMPPKDESNPLNELDISLLVPMSPFENEVPCSRPPGGVADNSGFSGLLSPSLDAFQNFTIF